MNLRKVINFLSENQVLTINAGKNIAYQTTDKQKIVNLTHIDDIMQLINFITSVHFVKLFHKSKLLFAISVENDCRGNFTQEDVKALETTFCTNGERPFLLIVGKQPKAQFLFRESGRTDLLSSWVHHNLSFADQVPRSNENLDFVSIVEKVFEAFEDENHLKSKMQLAFKEALSGSSLLSAIFMTLFRKVVLIDDSVIDKIVQNQNFRNLIAALFDFPFKADHDTLGFCNEASEHPSVSPKQKDLLNIFLIRAIKSKNENYVKFILKFKIDTTKFVRSNNEASTSTLESPALLAFDLSLYEVLLDLFKAGFEIPENFDLNKVSEKLKSYFKIIDDFHKNIQSNNLNLCKSFIKKNPTIKTAFNFMNESPLRTALTNERFEIFALLESHGFQSKADEKLEDLIKDLFDECKEDLLTARKLFQLSNEKDYVFDLIRKSTCDGKNRVEKERNQKIIKKAFEELDQISMTSMIMKIISKANVLNILFLFKSEFINSYDVTQKVELQGITYYKDKSIVVGASFLLDSTRYDEGLSILAHEMAHLAMFSIFQNEGKPYFYEDKKIEERFNEIIRLLRDLVNRNEIIDNVFTTDYPEWKFINELIVCVPEMIVCYKNKKIQLDLAATECRKLFVFYEKHVQTRFKEELPLVEIRQEAQTLNKNFGEMDKIERSPQSGFNLELEATEGIKVYYTNKPKKILSLIYAELFKKYNQRTSSMFIFAALTNNHYERYFNLAMNCLEPNSLPGLIIDASNFDIKQHSPRKFLNLIRSTRNTFIVAYERKGMKSYLDFFNFELGVKISQKLINI